MQREVLGRGVLGAVAATVALLAMPAAAVARQSPPPETSTAQPAGGVRGTVTSAGCAPVAGAAVTADDGAGTVAATVTDAVGDFVLDGLAPGGYTVAVVSPLAAYETGTAAARVVAGGRTRADVVLPAAARPFERVAGSGRVLTAVAASRRAFPDGAPAAVVAAARSFPDALAAAPLAARLGGPLLLADRRSGTAVLAELARLGVAEVVIVGAVEGVTAVVQSELLRAGLTVRRIAGDGRFDTAALVARELGSGPGGEVAVASGGSFADALSFAPLAAARGIPVLLTESAALNADAAAALTAIGATRTLVLGGETAVSPQVAAALPDPVRVAGPDRYATSVAIARLARDRGANLGTVYVATGRDFPDALAAGPAAGRDGAPLLLVDGAGSGEGQDEVTFQFLAEHLGEVETVVGLGGQEALAEPVTRRLARPGAAGQPCG